MKPDPAFIRRALLEFYDSSRRDLPWRRTSDPYRIWVSEVMLQQTRVETVVPYYLRWLEQFPTVDALAEASLDDVLGVWKGLGYYSRARNLHRAARVVREEHGGRVPATWEGLRGLPGVGEYTAGAVGSIAFGLAVPVVDGNVRRVLSRLFDLEDPGDAELRGRAADLVDPHRPGDFNQALMELGATVCTPRNPVCDACPLADACLARARGTIDQRPPPKKRARIRERVVDVAVIAVGPGSPGPGADGADGLAARDPVFLVRRRPGDGLLGGMWEFPERAAVREVLGSGGASAALDPDGGVPLPEVRHVFTHLRASYRPRYQVLDRWSGDLPEGWRWATARELEDMALPVAQQKILAHARAV